MTAMQRVSLDNASVWDLACKELARRDPVMAERIRQAGSERLTGKGDPFRTLVRSIVGQQISVKAADAIWRRLMVVCPDCRPAGIAAAGEASLASCGLSKRKIDYLQDLAFHFLARKIRIDCWKDMSDEEVIADLVQVRGIGRWTAEMFLIFNLLRPDVLPRDDVGLQKAVSALYFSGQSVSRSEIRKIATNWVPWRTVATWYLWRSLTPLPVEY